MSGFPAYSRDELRQAYTEAWRKRVARAPLTPLEAMIVDVLELHPEYQALVANAHGTTAFETAAGGGRENPFLHLGLHLAVREQIAVDRPPGVRAMHRTLLAEHGDLHTAEHVLVEALNQTLWEAQRSGAAPDERQYLDKLRRRLPRG